MADVTIKYKGVTKATMNASGTKTAKTAGKYVEDDIVVEYIKPSGGGANLQTKSIRITEDGNYVVTPDAGYDGMDEVDIAAVVNVGFKTGTLLFATNTILPVDISAPTADYLLILCEDDLMGSNGMQCLYAINQGDGEAHQAFGVRGNQNSDTSMSLINYGKTKVQFANGVITVTLGQSGAEFVAGKTYRWYAW